MKSHFFPTDRRGFTLIELMVAISILVIVSAVGLVGYSQAQKAARDAKRKADLHELQIGLELYRQNNGHYPVYGANGFPLGTIATWCSSDETCWTDGSIFSSNYISPVPTDPINDSAKFMIYLYRSNAYGASPGCGDGQYYALFTFLENINDPNRLQAKDVQWCDGSSVQAAYSSNPLFPRMYMVVATK